MKVSARRQLWKGGFLTAEEVTVTAESGGEALRYVVRHPGAVGIVALDGNEVVLVDEYRVPVERPLLQIPAGKLDVDGEDPLQCAQRELAEEVGLAATRWTHLSTFTTSPGFTDEWLHLYLAEGVIPVASDPQGVEEEGMAVVRVPLADVPALIAAGRICDAKTIVGVLMAVDRSARRQSGP